VVEFTLRIGIGNLPSASLLKLLATPVPVHLWRKTRFLQRVCGGLGAGAGWRRALYAAVLTAAVALAPVARLRALDPKKAIDQYGHESWTSQRGLPGEAVYQVLQTKDGYLWVRTGSGLARFDGVRFVSMDAEVGDEPVKAVCMSADGDLLIRTVSRTMIYRDRRFADYLPPHPLPGGAIRVLFESSGHVVFVGADDFIYRLEKDGTATLLRDHTGWINSFLEDHRGKIWIAGSPSILQLCERHTQPGHRRVRQSLHGYCLYEDRQHRIWAATGDGLHRVDEQGTSLGPAQRGAPGLLTTLLEDAQGNLWAGTESREWPAWRGTSFRLSDLSRV